MTIQERPRRPRKKGVVLNNRMLLMLTGILAVVLVVLLVVVGSIGQDSPDGESNALLSTGDGTTDATDTTGQTDTTETTVATNPTQTSAPTAPPTTAPARPVTPSGGKYINVGSGYIAEVIQNNVETFDGKTTDDYSRVTNNYLPKGTVDYCDRDTLVVSENLSYVVLRSGHRVYAKKKIYPPVQKVPEVKQYEGTLPDHNEIGVVSLSTQGHHTILTLDCLWKAPFYFDVAPQNYSNPKGGSDRSYSVTSNTATYVDITFCYASVFTGNVSIPSDHPLFKSAELIENESDYTLRLHLRKKGGFYGWHAYYNDQGQLCFQFLNPTKVTTADNRYGANLTGAVILVDVGHGGDDGGAVDKDKQYDEAELNMRLAQALKTELESMGATVIFNRTGDTNLHVNARQENLTQTSPDICIAIHQNSYNSASVSGFDSMYYTPYSKLLAQRIAEHTKETGVYTKSLFKWSVNYFMMRQTVCPVVLTENGYISNPTDLAGMVNPETIQLKAQAIAQGTADYFLEINQ